MEPAHVGVRTDRTEIVLLGGLSIAQTHEVHRQLNEALTCGQPIVIDADKLECIDGAGAQLLFAFCRAALARGLRLEWRAVSAELNRVAQLLGITDIFGAAQGTPNVPSP